MAAAASKRVFVPRGLNEFKKTKLHNNTSAAAGINTVLGAVVNSQNAFLTPFCHPKIPLKNCRPIYL